MANTHRRRDATAELRRVGGVYCMGFNCYVQPFSILGHVWLSALQSFSCDGRLWRFSLAETKPRTKVESLGGIFRYDNIMTVLRPYGELSKSRWDRYRNDDVL